RRQRERTTARVRLRRAAHHRSVATSGELLGDHLKTAQTRLGHSDPRLTLAVYAQATTEADRDAAERLDKRFFARPAGNSRESSAAGASNARPRGPSPGG